MLAPTQAVGVFRKRGNNMKIINDTIQEPLCIHNAKFLYRQLREIDRLTRNEEISTLVDTNRKCLIINRRVHPNLFIINYVVQGSLEKEIVIMESDLYES